MFRTSILLGGAAIIVGVVVLLARPDAKAAVESWLLVGGGAEFLGFALYGVGSTRLSERRKG